MTGLTRGATAGVLHQTVEEAIVHAEQHLGCFRKTDEAVSRDDAENTKG